MYCISAETVQGLRRGMQAECGYKLFFFSSYSVFRLDEGGCLYLTGGYLKSGQNQTKVVLCALNVTSGIKDIVEISKPGNPCTIIPPRKVLWIAFWGTHLFRCHVW